MSAKRVGGQFVSSNPVSDPISGSWLARSTPGALTGWSPEDRNPTVFWLTLRSVFVLNVQGEVVSFSDYRGRGWSF